VPYRGDPSGPAAAGKAPHADGYSPLTAVSGDRGLRSERAAEKTRSAGQCAAQRRRIAIASSSRDGRDRTAGASPMTNAARPTRAAMKLVINSTACRVRMHAKTLSPRARAHPFYLIRQMC